MTTPRISLTVRYNPILGWAVLLLGGINLFLGLWLLALGVPGISLVLGPLFTALGVLYLRREYFTYSSYTRTIEVVAPIGSRRPFTAERGAQFVVDGGRIVIRRGPEKGKKLPVYRYMSNRADWEAVAAALRQRPDAT